MEYLQGKKRLPLLKQSFNCSHPHWSPCLSWWKRKQEENRIEESLYCIGKLIPSMTCAFWLSRADLPTLCVSNFYDFCWGILWQAFLMVWIWFLFSDKVKVKVVHRILVKIPLGCCKDFTWIMMLSWKVSDGFFKAQPLVLISEVWTSIIGSSQGPR